MASTSGSRRRNAATTSREAPAPGSGGRDAAASREAILFAGEQLFAARGYAGASLADVAAAAGLSRGAPSYFFGSKDGLYEAVLLRAFARREEALAEALAPLHRFAAGRGRDDRGLRRALDRAAAGYLGFLTASPTFVGLMSWEAATGGDGLDRSAHESHAIEEALRALRTAARRRELRAFDVGEALVCFVALTFFPFAHRHTFLAAQGVDADDPAFLRRRRRQVVDVMAHLIARAG